MAENSERSLRKPKRVFANLTNQFNDFSFIWKLKERNSGWKANQGFSFPSVLEEREWGAEKWIRKLLQLARYEGLEKILTLWMMSVYLWEIAWEKGKKKIYKYMELLSNSSKASKRHHDFKASSTEPMTNNLFNIFKHYCVHSLQQTLIYIYRKNP